MGLVDRVSAELALRQPRDAARRGSRNFNDFDMLSLDDYASLFQFAGNTYPLVQTTMGSIDREKIIGEPIGAYQGNAAVFSLVTARIQAFSQVAFQWSRFNGAKPGDLFGTQDLKILENPWPNGYTPHLLAQMELHNSLAGNAYVARPRIDRLSCLRPDMVTIILGSQTDEDYPADASDCEVLGYGYMPRSGRPQIFLPNELAHYAPIPDPNYRFLGQSWITPCIREVAADSLATEHKARFFTNAACQPMYSKVLTPNGWGQMGDVTLGSQVIGSDGRAHYVTGVFPKGQQDIYRVTFSDGSQTDCTDDHVWQVACLYDRKRDVSRLMTLRQIIDGGVRYKSGPAKWAVQLVEPVEFAFSGSLPVEPYLLGALLGDGSFRGNVKDQGGVSFAAAAEDADEMVESFSWLLPEGMSTSRRDRGGWSEFYFKAPGQRGNPLADSIRALGLWGVLGNAKSIPDRYMRAAVIDRVALLQGLIDTDGSVDRFQRNLVRFSSTSERLSNQVAELTRSLGGVASVTRSHRDGSSPQWNVTVMRLPEWITPCRLSRKVSRYLPPSFRAPRWRYITDVCPAGRQEVQCIQVDTPDSLYVTDGYILTHNTPNLAIKFDPAVPIEHVKAFKELMENDHKGAFNAYKCMTPETPIAMWDGRRVRADEVRPGDEVVAWAGGEAVPGLVTRSEWQPDAPIVTVRTQRGRVLRTTPQHQYLARQEIRRSPSGIVVQGDEGWVNAADLKPGNLVRVGMGWAGSRDRDVLTGHEAWALGALTGDGSLVASTPSLTTADPGILSRMRVGYVVNPCGQANRPYDYRVLGIRALCNLHGMLGKRSWEKRVPAAVMVGSAKVQAAFLAGLIDTDGHVSDPATRHSAEIGITSTSLELLCDAQHLLAGLGLNASVSSPRCMAPGSPGIAIRRHQGHRLCVHGNDQARLLNDLIDLACQPKNVRLAEYATRTSRQRRSLHDRVAAVEVGAPEPTIGLEIAEWHTHVTGGIVTHNTLYMGGGADPVVVGKDFQQLDFAVTQGKGESRLASAAGVPPSWVGFSEGLKGSALNGSNFSLARRRFSDGPQPLDAKVLTPSGWTTMGELSCGDMVIGSDGLPHEVLETFEQPEQDIYKVSFIDGTSAECSLGHGWTVSRDAKREKWRTLTLGQIMETGFRKPGRPPTWAVPLPDPVEYVPQEETLPIDPYLLGLLLGDGTFTGTIRIASGLEDVAETMDRITPLLPDGVSVRRQDQLNERGSCSTLHLIGERLRDRCRRGHEYTPETTYMSPGTDYRQCRVCASASAQRRHGRTLDGVGYGDGGELESWNRSIMVGLVDELGLKGVTLGSKFIPPRYMKASVKDRVALLQGLIDSDGCVTTQGSIRFTNSAVQLLDGVTELVRSLGGMAWRRHSAREDAGGVGELAISRLPEWIVPVRLLRKVDRLTPPVWRRVKSMTGAEVVRRAPTRCILVDSPDHLYVTNDFTLTHNTLYHLWLVACAALQGIVPGPPGARLWYDANVPFMREDATDVANIQSLQATTISALVMQGFTPDSVVKAIANNDMTLLKHSGLASVQLQPLNAAASGGGPNPGTPPKAATVAGNGASSIGGKPEASADEGKP